MRNNRILHKVPATNEDATERPNGQAAHHASLSAAVEPLLVRRVKAAAICGLSRATWDRLDAAARTPSAVRLGAAKLYRVEDLRLWVSWGCPDRNEFEARKAVK